MIAVFITGSAFCQAPKWVNEFRTEVKQIQYDDWQDSLRKLHGAHKGNCVAFAKLAAEIAIKHDLVCESISIVSYRQWRAHRIALIHDSDGRLWSVFNDAICQVSSMKNAVKKAISQYSMGKYGDCTVRDRHVFKKRELR